MGGGGFHRNQFPTFDAESKFAKIKSSHFQGGGGGFVETNFQLLMLSPNLLKSKVPILEGGGGFVETNFQLLMLSPNLLKSKVPILEGGVRGNQFPTFDAEFKFAKIQNSHVQYRGGGVETNCQLLMLSSNLLKSKIPMSDWRGGGGVGTNFQLLMLSPILLKKKKKKKFLRKFF